LSILKFFYDAIHGLVSRQTHSGGVSTSNTNNKYSSNHPIGL
jgi:hypothetical protein